MTSDQYIRANEKVYPVVVAQMIMQLLFSIANLFLNFSVIFIVQIVVAIVGIVVSAYFKNKHSDSKKGAIGLLGSAACVYFVFVVFDKTNLVYAFTMPLMAASIIYLNVRFLYYGCGVTIVANIIHIIVMFVSGNKDYTSIALSVIIIGLMTYVAFNVSILLTKFNEENLDIQQKTSEKMLVVANNLIKHFDNVKDAMEKLNNVIDNNCATMSDIAATTDTTAAAIQKQALMCRDIKESTDVAGKETGIMIEKSVGTQKRVEAGGKLVAGLRVQADNVEKASNVAAEATKQLSNRVKDVEGIVEAILNISSQTNLLALNASIEAARAGEAGRGFAVVADEIRQLSEQTKDATNKITDIISELSDGAISAIESMNESTDSIKEQTELIDTAGEAFKTIDEEVKDLTIQIEKIEEIMKVILDSTDTIADNIESLSATSEEVAASSVAGVETANGAVEEVKKAQTIIDTTYLLAQDLKEAASK